MKTTAQAAQGGLKVLFHTVVHFSKSKELSYDYMEQTWVPGKPWWSSLTLTDPSSPLVLHYTLLEKKSGGKPR